MVYSTRRFVLSLTFFLFLCFFVFFCFFFFCLFVFFSPFSIPITSLWEDRANLGAFRMFVQRACLVLSVSSSFWCLGRAAVCDCGTPRTFLPFFFFFFVFIFYYSNMYWVIYRSDINTFLLWVSWILRDMHVLKHILNFIDDVAAATCPRGRWARGTPLYIHVVIEAGGGSHQLHFGGWGHIVHMRHTSLWRYSYWGTVRVLGWIE